ncbi:MAG: T9SS type A sorting domain-containing protein [Bacteroidetes bacterium]|nr:T9SS type A sorting domain-containing protein [Bacteroidota bacterium]
MRKLQWFLGFILFASQIWGQGFERSFKASGMEQVVDMDSLGFDLWRLNLSYSWGGPGPNYGYTCDALFDRSSLVLGPLKIVSNTGYGSGYYRIPLQYHSSSRAILLGSYRSHPFITASWINLKDTTEQNWVDIPKMAVSLNWEIGHNDSTYGLYNRLDYYTWADNGRKGTEYFYLSLMTKDSDKLQILDSFRLKADIYAPGTFLLNEDGRGFEYINDSLHYHYSRGKQEPDTFYVDTGAFYGGPKVGDWLGDYYLVNYLSYINHRLGKFRKEESSSGYQVYQVFEDGSEQLIRTVIYPHINQAVLNRTNWHRQDFRIYEQEGGITCMAYKSSDEDTLFLVRTSGNQILKSRLFVRKPSSDFQLSKAYSFADGSFLLMGRIKYQLSLGSDGWSIAHLIYIDPSGKTTALMDDEVFSLHFQQGANRLKIFFENSSSELNYRILDASGRFMQEGEFQAYEGIQLGDWRTGIYYLQLWNKEGAYLGQQSFLKGN